MKKTTLTFSIIMATAISCQAVTATWTDTLGDHDWGNTNNWSTLALPTDADTASFPDAIGGVTNYPVYLNGDRHVDRIAMHKESIPFINGPENTLTVDVQITGSKGGDINTHVVFPGDGIVRCGDSWAYKIYLSGGMEAPGTVSFPGSHNNMITVTSGVYRVGNIVADAKASFQNCVITNTTLTVATSWVYSSDNRTTIDFYSTAKLFDTSLSTDKGAGIFNFYNSDSPATITTHTVSQIRNNQGILTLVNQFYGGTNFVEIQSLVREPGTAVRITNSQKGGTIRIGENEGFFIPGAVNTNGTYAPWIMDAQYLVKVNALGALERCATTEYVALPAASYNPTDMYRQAAVGDINLDSDAEVWAWLIDGSFSANLNLGGHDFKLGSGNFSVYGSGTKKITSAGGRFIVGGEDLILYANSSGGSLEFAAPIAWEKPASSTVDYPSLIVVYSSFPEIIFSGEDLIGDYYALSAESGGTVVPIIFDGSSDRNFHGPLVGRYKIIQRGTGTLTLSGPDRRRASSLDVENGTVVLADPEAAAPTTVTNGAVCIVADGIAYTKNLNSQAGGILCMAGNTGSVGTQNPLTGGRIEGGAPGELGTFNTTGAFKPGNACTVGLKIAESGSSLINVGAKLEPPSGTAGVTMTIRVEDISNGAANIHTSDVFTVLIAHGLTNSNNPMSYVFENGSPGFLDISAAQATRNASTGTITLTGVRSLRGTMIMIK